jgi:predicted CXXCH cytochrome family protein
MILSNRGKVKDIYGQVCIIRKEVMPGLSLRSIGFMPGRRCLILNADDAILNKPVIPARSERCKEEKRGMPSRLFPATLCCFLFLTAIALSAPKEKEPEPINCLDCHADLAPEKGVHPAVAMGCPSCHSAIDASEIPHKKKNAIAKGLSADQPQLCYGCHDQSLFEKKTVHAAIGMGCTGCHNPHASTNPKLLIAVPPDLCYNCHDKGMFTKKSVHPPVAAGMCTSCHSPHSSDQASLLLQPVSDLCATCHDAVTGRHVLTGYGLGDVHPLKGKPDPSKAGRELSCISCHDPHSSSGQKLFRNEAVSSANLCLMCHTKVVVRTDGP